MAITWGNIKTLVTNNLARQGDTNVLALLPIWAGIIQLEMQADRNYWFLKTVADRTITNAAQTYPLPSNFRDDMVFYIKKTKPTFSADEYVELDLISDIDAIRTYAPVTEAGEKAEPQCYVIGNNAMTFWPYPDQDYVIRCHYWKDVDAPVAASADAFTNSWIDRHPKLYAAKLTAEGFKYLQDSQNSLLWEQVAEKALQDAKAANVMRELPGNLVLAPRMDAYGTVRTSLSNTWRVYN